MSERPRWADLPATPQTDAALRRAAAERVMGWNLWFDIDPTGFWGKRSDDYEAGEDDWLIQHDRLGHPAWNRDDLARVFAAGTFDAPELVTVGRLREAWIKALSDPRAALCQLLDLLNIELPEDLTNGS